jgi:CxxC motif-containing protein
MKRELTCISCPIGCALTAEVQPDGTVAVSGNQCARGVHYAREELVDPRRVVTATCRTSSSIHPRLPVRTSEPCPRELIPAVLSKIYSLSVPVPVIRGNVLGAVDGVQIVATRSLDD